MLKGIPFDYLFERLAARWHVPPYEIEAAMDDPLVQAWVVRGLLFMCLEAVEVKQRA